ncbi:Ubiquitin supergroup [Metarhizium album ARSEF 1941]|uniref:Ubiquitin supergroup n=1 Tax=Metarhizium album (strain ARSEF 1941) TaxID=1081103 RepID=A0A0B2X0I6_METAS|nr:Ubiquitin supergroup [Metarhizium album ARSEF 1941]KHO02052.1 Ubiquitin supergroup [Metarhizium album ARSEF 1941]
MYALASLYYIFPLLKAEANIAIPSSIRLAPSPLRAFAFAFATMAEAAFAKTFLSSLDSRPIKLSPDHVEDAKSFPPRPPVRPSLPQPNKRACNRTGPEQEKEAKTHKMQYILPRMPNPMSKPRTVLPGQERSLTVTLKSLRNPPLDLKLTSQPLNTSILDIKTRVARQTSIPVDKMKILHNKRPLTDSKVLKDVVGDSDLRLDLSVMVMGGAAAMQPEGKADAAAKASGWDALTTDAFWDDLRGFLEQRLKDENAAADLGALFKRTWESSRSATMI